MSEPLFQHTKTEECCPQCGSPLQIKQGKKGKFLGCSAYPACDYLKPLSNQSESRIIKQLDECCPQCGHPLLIRQGNFGMFIGCGNYPQCHFIVHEDEQPRAEESVACPECGKGELISRRGRQGKYFYACNRYPHCKFTLPGKPYLQDCPQCGGHICLLKKENEMYRTFLCVNKSCRHQFDREKEKT